MVPALLIQFLTDAMIVISLTSIEWCLICLWDEKAVLTITRVALVQHITNQCREKGLSEEEVTDYAENIMG